MARGVQVVFDCAVPARVGAFWADALGYVEEPPPAGFDTWPEALDAMGVPADDRDIAYAVVDPAGVGPRLFFQRVPEPKTVKNRVHLDIRVSEPSLSPADRTAQIEAEAERLEGVGARRVELISEYGSTFMVMADVEDNEFCVS